MDTNNVVVNTSIDWKTSAVDIPCWMRPPLRA
jgi:hypothetical protein